jgi:hypothetical protein
MKLKIYLLCLALILVLPACAFLLPGMVTVKPTGTPVILISPPGSVETLDPTRAAPAPGETPATQPVQLTANEQAAIQAMSAKYNIPADQIHLVKSEPVTWPTGCLGVVLPGVMCTQGTVDGFKLILEAAGRQYEYHTNTDGANVIDAAQQLATLQFVVSDSNNQLKLVSPAIPLGSTYNPSFSGFLPAGGSVNQTAYVLDFTNGPKAVALDANGTRDLSFIKNPNYALALWPGGGTGQPQPRLAWGTQPTDASAPTTLQISSLDGSQLQTILSADPVQNKPEQLVAEFWSADGQSLYFSRELVGIGGYIPFSGASNLYSIDIATKQVTTLIPAGSRMICLDALSADFRYVADHCSSNSITVRDLQQNTSATIQPPADASGYALVGSARFSPSGNRLAFALAKGDPSNEQGWVAVSDGLSGASKLILTSKPGMLYTIHGWLNDQTILLETRDNSCTSSDCGAQLWTIASDGSNFQKVADGSYLAIIDNR